MGKNFDYSSTARRFVARFPMLSYVLTQVNFWVLANVFLGLLSYLQSMSVSQLVVLPVPTKLSTSLIIALIIGVFYGIILGIIDYYLDKKFFRRMPLGKLILLKSFISLAVLTLLFSFLRFVLYEEIVVPTLSNADIGLNEGSWKYFYYQCLVFYLVMTIIITFINQVNNKYGPGVLIPILLGKYRTPKEEERIFMFMDLKASTTIAEALGHIQYSSFIRDSFMDINQVLPVYNAEVYQYVGDEIVVSWPVKDGLKDFRCINFYFACEKQFEERKEYYTKNYGQVPHFKAGMHMGKVTAVEIGEIKRDIAYHGDTLNTAARIQSMCNQYEKKFLVSGVLLETPGILDKYNILSIGNIVLKGKTEAIEIASIEAKLISFSA